MSVSTKRNRVCHLSPNEEAAVLQEQREARRKERLLQVRQQERVFARSVRGQVKERRERERSLLEQHLQATLEQSHEEELRELEKQYLSRMGQLGAGHRDAQLLNQEENRLQELRVLLKAEQRWRAEDRHKAAMQEVSQNQLREKQARGLSQSARRRALEAERGRAREVAAAAAGGGGGGGGKKGVPGNALVMDFTVGRGRRVQLKEVEGYASTYYHIPGSVVHRAASPEPNQLDAREMADAVTEQDMKMQKKSAVAFYEQQEKARLRHKHAMAKVRLEKERVEVLQQLEVLEREDRTHRQKALAKMPATLFQPTHRRLEIVSEQQRDMEEDFEKLFVYTHGVHTHGALSSIADHAHQADHTHPSGDHTHQTLEGADRTTSSSSHSEREPFTEEGEVEEEEASQHQDHSLSDADTTLMEQSGMKFGDPQTGPNLADPRRHGYPAQSDSRGMEPPPRTTEPLSAQQATKQSSQAVPTTSTGVEPMMRTPFIEREPFHLTIPDLSICTVSPSELETTTTSHSAITAPPPPPPPPPSSKKLDSNSSGSTTSKSSSGIAGLNPRETDSNYGVNMTGAGSLLSKELAGSSLAVSVDGGIDGSGGDASVGVAQDKGGGALGGRWETASAGSDDAAPLKSGNLSRKGEGMQRLISLIHSQHQAWSQRLSSRPHPPHPLTTLPTVTASYNTTEKKCDSNSESSIASSLTTPEAISFTDYHTTLDQSQAAPHTLTTLPTVTTSSHMTRKDSDTRSSIASSLSTPEPMSFSDYQTTLDQSEATPHTLTTLPTVTGSPHTLTTLPTQPSPITTEQLIATTMYNSHQYRDASASKQTPSLRISEGIKTHSSGGTLQDKAMSSGTITSGVSHLLQQHSETITSQPSSQLAVTHGSATQQQQHLASYTAAFTPSVFTPIHTPSLGTPSHLGTTGATALSLFGSAGAITSSHLETTGGTALSYFGSAGEITSSHLVSTEGIPSSHFGYVGEAPSSHFASAGERPSPSSLSPSALTTLTPSLLTTLTPSSFSTLTPSLLSHSSIPLGYSASAGDVVVATSSQTPHQQLLQRQPVRATTVSENASTLQTREMSKMQTHDEMSNSEPALSIASGASGSSGGAPGNYQELSVFTLDSSYTPSTQGRDLSTLQGSVDTHLSTAAKYFLQTKTTPSLTKGSSSDDNITPSTTHFSHSSTASPFAEPSISNLGSTKPSTASLQASEPPSSSAGYGSSAVLPISQVESLLVQTMSPSDFSEEASSFAAQHEIRQTSFLDVDHHSSSPTYSAAAAAAVVTSAQPSGVVEAVSSSSLMHPLPPAGSEDSYFNGEGCLATLDSGTEGSNTPPEARLVISRSPHSALISSRSYETTLSSSSSDSEGESRPKTEAWSALERPPERRGIRPVYTSTAGAGTLLSPPSISVQDFSTPLPMSPLPEVGPSSLDTDDLLCSPLHSGFSSPSDLFETTGTTGGVSVDASHSEALGIIDRVSSKVTDVTTRTSESFPSQLGSFSTLSISSLHPSMTDDSALKSATNESSVSHGASLSTSELLQATTNLQDDVTTQSLQEAFLRKKARFLESSKSRLQKVQENATQRRIESSMKLEKSTGGKNVVSRSRSSKKPKTVAKSLPMGGDSYPGVSRALSPSRGGSKLVGSKSANEEDARTRGVTFSSPLLSQQQQQQQEEEEEERRGAFTPPAIHRGGRRREKIAKAEMKERNLRFYQRLPEVRQRREEEERSQSCADNREKARNYHQKLRSHMQRSQAVSGTGRQTSSSSSAACMQRNQAVSGTGRQTSSSSSAACMQRNQAVSGTGRQTSSSSTAHVAKETKKRRPFK